MATLPERFGPFLVSGTVGAGGLGEVFRARDSRLHRDVAIKVLSRAGPEAVRRFTSEAQAASALNHPNIVTVYDVGVHDDVPYIVSELVDGASLRGLLGRAPLPVREVLDLAVQMAEGLAAAHAAGIVHRDFKPENVMVTREGRVKILDFGLAQVGSREGLSAPLDVTQTLTGVIVGTVPYMSPEQARGANVDFRTDQFSFGLTVYELLTGRRAFEKETAPQTLTAILQDEPEAIVKLNPRVPAPVRWIVDRCLAKDPRQRYESTTDLARELSMLRDRLSEFSPISDEVSAPSARPRRWAALAAAVAIAAAIGVFAGRLSSTPAQPLDHYRFTPFATDAGYQSSPVWSPDGKTLAYVAAADGVLQVFSKNVGSPLRVQVTHTRFDCQDPFWSPDGTRLYYVSLARDRLGLWSISTVGGDADLVMENVLRAAISPNGRTLAMMRTADNEYGGANTLWLSSPPGNAPTQYTRGGFGDRRFFESRVSFSPDGSKIGLMTQNSAVPEFWIIPMGDADPRLVSSRPDLPNFAAPFSWLPDSQHIVSAMPVPRPGVHLWLTDTTSSDARLITASGSVENDPAVSPDGTRLATDFQQANYDIYQLSLDHAALVPVLASARNEMDPAWSTSGSQLAYTTDRSGTDEIWLRSQNGEFERPVVAAPDFRETQTHLLSAPAFSPDGQRIAYFRQGSDGGRIWISPVAGGPPVVLARSDDAQDLPNWSPDGAWIVYPQNAGGQIGKWSLAKTRVGAKAPPQVLVPDIVPLSPVKWAPAGDWIAYDGRAGLSVVSPDGQSMRALSEEPWIAFDWSADSRQLIGIRQSDDYKHLTLTSVDVRSGKEHVILADLMPMPVAAQPVRGFTRVSTNAFLTSIVRVSSDIWLLEGFMPSPGRSLDWSRLWRERR
ncbi:MAG TPA: protein kinase [Vicinamibacterales bacterium]